MDLACTERVFTWQVTTLGRGNGGVERLHRTLLDEHIRITRPHDLA